MQRVEIKKPTVANLTGVAEVLSQWTDGAEVTKYVARITAEIEGKVEFNGQYWVALRGGDVVGVVGLGDPLPQLLAFTKTLRPGKFKVLYVDGRHHGEGIGKQLVAFIEGEARRQGYTEFLARSAERYRGTAYGFYKELGYDEAGTVYANEDHAKPMLVLRKVL